MTMPAQMYRLTRVLAAGVNSTQIAISASRREDSNRGGQRSLFGHNDRRDYRGGAQGTDRPQHAKNQQRH